MIQEIVESVSNQLVVPDSSPAVAPTYIHGWSGWQNLSADEIVNDIIFLDEPIRSDDSFVGSNLIERYRLVVHFYTKSQLDYSPSQHLPLINKMRIQRKKFLNLIRQQVRSITSIQTLDVMNAMDVGLTGCVLNIVVEPFDEVSLC